jgi:glycosyltransferase involved in cell wall biosynthesis
MSTRLPSSWLCCQIGAREHYAIPRSLHAAGLLNTLFTDLWLPPGHPMLYVLGARGAGRFHEELAYASVVSTNFRELAGSLKNRLSRISGWPVIMRRNAEFQRSVLRHLKDIHQEHPNRHFTLFCYSYAAKSLFEYAKSIGWTTVLGQIDPGPVEEDIVAALHRSVGTEITSFCPAPAAYWHDWQIECQLADSILVNSEWSRQALLRSRITNEKISIIPLVFQPDPEATAFERHYPEQFTAARPLRLLFLGQAGLRKGIQLVTLAAEQLACEPVEIHVVGPIQISLPAHLANHPILRWHGSVPRSATATHYRNADVFLFPTFSDGFGLTQLEAQAWQLPLLVSPFCGHVVEHETNGLVLDPLTADTLVGAIRSILQAPHFLTAMSRQAWLRPEHRIDGLAERLSTAVNTRASLR